VPNGWYESTIDSPNVSQAGFRWAQEFGGASQAPGAGAAFIQTLNPFDDSRLLDSTSASTLRNSLIARNVLYGLQASLFVAQLVTASPMQIVGQVAVDVVERVVENAVEKTIRMILNENSPSYAWMTLTLPDDANYLSIDFRLDRLSAEDLFTLGNDGNLLFALEGSMVADGQTFSTGLLDISAWQGLPAELFFGLSSGGVTGGSITLENFQFYSFIGGGGSPIPEPSSLLLATAVMGMLAARRRR